MILTDGPHKSWHIPAGALGVQKGSTVNRVQSSVPRVRRIRGSESTPHPLRPGQFRSTENTVPLPLSARSGWPAVRCARSSEQKENDDPAHDGSR
jgi:hypothetical protein